MKMRIPTAQGTGLETCEMLTLSTAHITGKTAEMLRQESHTNVMSLSVYEKKGSCGESYGWFIYLNEVQSENIPDDLMACIKFAKDNHCGILCLDCDGPVIPMLESFDW